LAALCDIATPHIAGYSKQGREKGTWFIYQSVCSFFDIPLKSSFSEAVSQGSICEIKMNSDLGKEEALNRAIQCCFDVARDSARFKYVMSSGEDKGFDWLRKKYVERDEFNTACVNHDQYTPLFSALGFSSK
ncbi:MAG: 4-phosphoerythronate dehydrogenase, partial [Marinomonas sp.]